MLVGGRGLTADSVGVVVRVAQEVRHRNQQRGEAGQQRSAADEPRPVDSTAEETHKDDEDRVPHLKTSAFIFDGKIEKLLHTRSVCRISFMSHIEMHRRHHTLFLHLNMYVLFRPVSVLTSLKAARTPDFWLEKP